MVYVESPGKKETDETQGLRLNELVSRGQCPSAVSASVP